jgi:hypothetical protein
VKPGIGRTTYKLAFTKIESENTQARMSGYFGFFFFFFLFFVFLLFEKEGFRFKDLIKVENAGKTRRTTSKEKKNLRKLAFLNSPERKNG